MPFGNLERSWLDGFWSLWQRDHLIDLEPLPHDIWTEEPSIPTTFDTHDYHFILHDFDPSELKRPDEY